MNDKKHHGFLILLIIILYGAGAVRAQIRVLDIPLPSSSFKRLPAEPGSFGEWLRHLTLKEKKTPVLDFRGKVFKSGEDSIVASVLDIDIKGRRLEQCMDIIVRIYADYLWAGKQTAELSLPLPGGTYLNWVTWKDGFRPIFKGIKVTLKKNAAPDSSKQSYTKYLNTVFAESHTQQFYYAYKPVPREEIAIGDFIVKKGTTGHAVMIVDLAKNSHGDLIALVGNGDTPACQFFLINYKNKQPWVPLSFDKNQLELPLKRKMTWDGLRRFKLSNRGD
jgi:hypothetical protein